MPSERERMAHLVKERTDEKHHQRAEKLIPTELADQRGVDMSFAEVVHDGVPAIPELVQIAGVPPVAIEEPVAEPKQFSEQIQRRVEVHVEERQPEQMVRQCQSKETFGVLQMGVLIERPIDRGENRQDPLLHETVLQREKNENLCATPKEKPLADACRTRIVQFVAQGRRENEIVEISRCQIVRVEDRTGSDRRIYAMGTRVRREGVACRVLLTGFLAFGNTQPALVINVHVGEQLEKHNNIESNGDERTDGIRVTAVDVDHREDEQEEKIDELKVDVGSVAIATQLNFQPESGLNEQRD